VRVCIKKETHEEKNEDEMRETGFDDDEDGCLSEIEIFFWFREECAHAERSFLRGRKLLDDMDS